MKLIRVRTTTFLLFICLALTGCAIFSGGKKPVELRLRYDESSFINYGYSFSLRSVLIYTNGKEKDVTNKDELQITITGAQYYSGKVLIDAYPKKLSANTIRVNANYTKDGVSLTASTEIPFNYKGDIELDFRGAQGGTGADGSKGSSPLLFRDGNDGSDGLLGGDGLPGDNLTVYVWQDSVDYYFIKVTNLSEGTNYIYKIKENGYGFKFNVSGGRGGTGGNGGDGGDGKNGSNNNNKNKAPGNGGRGGNGGQGGTGGKGGNVYVFVHPNASQILSKIIAYNFGGPAGEGGNAGSGGRAGTALEGQTPGSAGVAGQKGLQGYTGSNGDVFQILIEPFDIEY